MPPNHLSPRFKYAGRCHKCPGDCAARQAVTTFGWQVAMLTTVRFRDAQFLKHISAVNISDSVSSDAGASITKRHAR